MAVMSIPTRAALAAFIKDTRTLRDFEALFNAVRQRPTLMKAANYTVQPSDSGSILVATAADVVFTLPPTADGLWYTIVFKVPSAGTGGKVSPDANDKIMGNGFTSANNKDAINSGATDREGDSITLAADGLDGWFIIGITGTWAREA